MAVTSSPQWQPTSQMASRRSNSAARSPIPCACAVAAPRRHSDGSLSGEIVSIDRFGNLISNIPAAWVATGRWRVPDRRPRRRPC